MSRFLLFNVRGPSTLAEALPDDLRTWVTEDRIRRGEGRLKFRFDGPEFGHVGAVRRWAAEQADAQVSEAYYAYFDGDDTERESLAWLFAGQLPDVEMIGGDASEELQCPDCSNVSTWRLDATDARLAPPSSERGLFRPKGSSSIVMSAALAEGLRGAGLDGGLHLLPVGEDGAWFAVSADVSLGMPACAAGVRETCSTCSYDRPAHTGFPAFDADAVPADWTYSEADGNALPMVSRRVADWLRGPGAKLLGEGHLDDEGPETALQLWPRGLHPQDADIAFLPEVARP